MRIQLRANAALRLSHSHDFAHLANIATKNLEDPLPSPWAAGVNVVGENHRHRRAECGEEAVEIVRVVDATDLGNIPNKAQLDRYDVAECILETTKPIAFDSAAEFESTGRFVVVDHYEIAGGGQPLVLIHGGLVNSGLWDDQFEVFAQGHRTLRYDVRGFGKSTSPASYFSNHSDLRDLLDEVKIERACVLGLSMGGAIAIDFTLAYPDRVAALIPVAAGLGGYHSAVTSPLRDELNAAYERGDKERAVELSLQMWTDGPHRTPDQVEPTVREHIRAMTSHTFDLPDVEPWAQRLEPPAIERLAEIHVPTLFIVGDQDVEDILKISDLIVAQVRGAQRVVIPGAAHHLNVEQPDEFNRIVLEFMHSLTH